jgi:hypothetical protein
MSNIDSTRLKELFQYDPNTGNFTWLHNAGKRVKAGQIAGCLHKNGYIQIGIDKKVHLAHRLVWLYVYGEYPKNQIDHRNGIRSDNRVANLRDATSAENCQNLLRARGSSGLLGAHFQKTRNRWSSSIKLNGTKTHLGYFKTAEDAHVAYLNAKRALHPFNNL